MQNKRAPKKRSRGGRVRAVRIEFEKAKRVSSEDVEEAIERKLASTKTDVFGNNETVVIVLEKHGK